MSEEFLETKTEKVAAVIVAAGRSTRMAGLDKQFSLFADQRPLLAHTIAVFESSPLIAEYVIVLNEDNLMRGRALAFEEGWRKLKKIVTGGARRQDSVWNGLLALEDSAPDWVMIHDGARPFVTAKILEDGLEAAREFGASVAGVPVKDTIKIVSPENLTVRETPPRDLLWAIQTPQIFRYNLIVAAHQQASARHLDVTDDAMMLEQLGQPVKLYQAAYTNLKITTPDDLLIARNFSQSSEFGVQSSESPDNSKLNPINSSLITHHSSLPPQSSIRVGQGYDVHRLVEGRPLILGGVSVPFELGLEGHSDADVLTHAIINALLGAAGLGDIGRYFPPTDPVYKDISSLKMLSHVRALLDERGWQVHNLDATIAAQRPKLARHIPAMREKLAEVLGLDPAQVNVKATTTETLGFVGRLEGLEAQAIALISRLAGMVHSS